MLKKIVVCGANIMLFYIDFGDVVMIDITIFVISVIHRVSMYNVAVI